MLLLRPFCSKHNFALVTYTFYLNNGVDLESTYMCSLVCVWMLLYIFTRSPDIAAGLMSFWHATRWSLCIHWAQLALLIWCAFAGSPTLPFPPPAAALLRPMAWRPRFLHAFLHFAACLHKFRARHPVSLAPSSIPVILCMCIRSRRAVSSASCGSPHTPLFGVFAFCNCRFLAQVAHYKSKHPVAANKCLQIA